ncbi:hypothetical protein FQN57_001702 [Myotisia sp. PD_48]|nr:hypothetical protein FQN57_001702 [Myotisia sp. PD_48]
MVRPLKFIASIAPFIFPLASAQSACRTVIAPSATPVAAPGYRFQVVANGFATPRSLQFDTEGNLLVALGRGGGIVNVKFKDNGGTCLELESRVDLIPAPIRAQINHGIALSEDGKTLYASSNTNAYAWKYDAATRSVTGEPTVVIKGMMNSGHSTRTLLRSKAFPDQLIAVRGSAGNIDLLAGDIKTGHCHLRTFNMTGVPAGGYDFTTQGKLLSWGLRNSVGIDEHPGTNEIWTVENSLDNAKRAGKDVHQNNPGEELNRHGTVETPTEANHGYPYCVAAWEVGDLPNNAAFKVGSQFAHDIPNDTKTDDFCAQSTAPRLTFPAHTAPLDFKFNGTNEAFVTFHGSWNRDIPIGYRLSRIEFANGEPVAASTSREAAIDVLKNHESSVCPRACFRPVGMAFDKQGRLWVVSDSTGEIYVVDIQDGRTMSTSSKELFLAPSASYVKRPYCQVLASIKGNIRCAFSRSVTTSTSSFSLATHQLAPNHVLFEYSRGRFLLGENEQISKHRVSFDMEQLASTAANSVGTTRCIDIEKCPDGLYNKAFILTMDNNRQVIAKVQNPNADRPYYTTTSEVATMDFARTVLQTPAPQVYTWNASVDPESNPVGAEFIIMEKMPGVLLSTLWWNLQPNQKLKIFLQIARYMRRWANVKFNKFGSLYHAKDSDISPKESLYVEDGNPISESRFVIGPSSNREWSDVGRQDLQFDRGPCNSAMAYRTAIGDRETTAVRTLNHTPKQLAMLFGPPPFYQPTIGKKLDALRYYRQILKVLLPDDPDLMTGHLWHNDLHHENIFVDPETLQIQGIIDWQSIQIAPLSDHCLDPSFLDYNGPDVGDNLQRPKLPAEIQNLKGEEKSTALEQYINKGMMIGWRSLIHDKNPAQYRAIKFQQTAPGNLLQVSRRIFEVGEPYFLALLLDLRDEWANAGIPQFPIEFSDEQVTSIELDVERAELGVGAIKAIQQELGDLWPEKGVVEYKDYGEVKSMLQQVKGMFIAESSAYPGWDTETFERLWPFDD